MPATEQQHIFQLPVNSPMAGGTVASGVVQPKMILIFDPAVLAREYQKVKVSVSHNYREAWLLNNPDARAAVHEGIAQAERGELTSLGSFSQYVDLDTE